MNLRTLLLAVCGLCISVASSIRVKRQEAISESEDYVEDYAGNENMPEYAGGNDKPNVAATVDNNENDNDVADYAGGTNDDNDVADYAGGTNDDTPKEEPVNPFKNTFDNPFKDNINDINEDRFGDDKFENDAPKSLVVKEELRDDSNESKHKKHSKKNKYLKKTLKKVSEFLKKVLDPNKLMENAYVTEMLRRFSDHETKEHVSKETEENHELEHEIPIPRTARRRRGRQRKKDKIPPGIGGMIKKGIMTLTQMEFDKRKLKRRVRLIKRIARKAKKPLKTAVKIFLSSRNQGVGMGYGGGGGYNNNY